MSDNAMPSADRAQILTELLSIQNNLLNGNIPAISGMANMVLNISEQSAAYIAEHGNNQQEILEQVFRGSYDMDDLHGAISNTALHADNIDGNLNTTSLLISPYLEEIQQLSAEQTIDHNALFKEVVKLGIVTQTSELMNTVSGIVPPEDRNESDIAEFNANFQAMNIIATNIAIENGVDIDKALSEVRQELSIESNVPEAKISSQLEHRFSFKRYDEPAEKRSLRPTEPLSNEDRADIINKIENHYETEGQDFLQNLQNDLTKTADTIRDSGDPGFLNKIALSPGYARLGLDGDALEKLQDIDKITGSYWGGLRREGFATETLNDWLDEDYPDIQLREALKNEEHKDFRIEIGKNHALQEKISDSLGQGTVDYDDFRQRWVGVVDYYQKHGTLDGSEKIFDLDIENVESSVEKGLLKPPTTENTSTPAAEENRIIQTAKPPSFS